MVRIFLLIIVILLIRKLISLLGKRSSINFAKQNEASDNQDIVYNEQNSVYVFDDEDMLLIEKESQDSIKTGLNTIIIHKYFNIDSLNWQHSLNSDKIVHSRKLYIFLYLMAVKKIGAHFV